MADEQLPLETPPVTPPSPTGDPAPDPAPKDGEASPPKAGDPPAGDKPADEGAPAGDPPKGDEPPAPDAPLALTLPENALLDPAALERVNTLAKTLGLSAEHAQAIVNAHDAELAGYVATLQQATAKGGAIYAETVAKFAKDALADPEIGGTPERLAVTVEQANAALARYDKDGSFKEFLEDTGWASNKAVLKLLAAVHADTKEDRMVVPGAPPAGQPKSAAQTLWAHMPSTEAAG